MGRNLRIEGITLHSRRFQEFHKDVTILSREGGIIHCVLHGGYKGKSRLAGATESFRRVNFLLYHNPVKDTYKISDAEIINSFELFRNDLAKIYLASLWSELMIKSRGTGAGAGEEGEGAYFLLLNCIAILEKFDTKKIPLLAIQFLWRFLEISGFGMDISCCSSCGRELSEREPLFFSLKESGFLCGECGSFRETDILSPGDSKYLKQTLTQEIFSSLRISPPGNSFKLLERIPLDFIRSTMEIDLKTPDYRQFI